MLRCGGMTLTHGRDDKGEWLKATYFDEDGTSVDERFRLKSPAQRKAFEQLFMRTHQRVPGWQNAADVVALQPLLRYPDFVVARAKEQFWQVRDKLSTTRAVSAAPTSCAKRRNHLPALPIAAIIPPAFASALAF